MVKSDFRTTLAWILVASSWLHNATGAELVGTTITPHHVAEVMRYRKPRSPDMAAKVQLFVKGRAIPGTFAGKSPDDLIDSGEWAWHDTAGLTMPDSDDILSVWSFNGRIARWGVNHAFELAAHGFDPVHLKIDRPQRWISAVTFLAETNEIAPRTVIAHLTNDSATPLKILSLRFWLPEASGNRRHLKPVPALPIDVTIPPNGKGYFRLTSNEPLPLARAAIEVKTDAGSIWESLRIKPERFDISGGWVGEHLQHEPYLKLLMKLHVNTGQIQEVPGYTDNPALFQRYPIKMYNRMMPLDKWDSDEWLPRIHAVEFLGEPQYGGGRPMPPQEVYDRLAPYGNSRLATSVTHSEERIWRDYAGLSDFPHYDAYRVVAPAADDWRAYDRWQGVRISWGAPLETIGDLCRSLKELNRPMPCGY